MTYSDRVIKNYIESPDKYKLGEPDLPDLSPEDLLVKFQSRFRERWDYYEYLDEDMKSVEELMVTKCDSPSRSDYFYFKASKDDFKYSKCFISAIVSDLEEELSR